MYISIKGGSKLSDLETIDIPGLPIMILDGANTIGGTKILVHEENRGLLLDFGFNFKQSGTYFEEFLKPRTYVGINDFWDLGLLPRYQELYRPDLRQIPSNNSMQLPVDDIDGVILSHAHEDHCGLISLLDESIPILSSGTSLALLRAVQDSGKSDVQKQNCYITQHVLDQCREQDILRSPNWNTSPHIGRQAIVTTNDLNDNLTNLWRRKANPDDTGRNITPGNVQNLEDTNLEWEITSFPVDHSILGACATKIETDSGNIYYTGDLRKSGAQRADTESFITEATNDSWVLIVEGTQVTREGECETTEGQCKTNCTELIDNAPDGLVIADFSARNIERLYSFIEIAHETDRTLIITAKDAYMLYCLNIVDLDRPLPSENLLIFDVPKASEQKWESWIYSRYNDFCVNASEISDNSSDYILAIGFFDIKYLNDIKPTEGLYLYSSSEPFSEEQQIDMFRLKNWITRHNLELRGITFENNEWQIEPGYHCSGHMTRTELAEMIRSISPENLIPVHTMNREWFNQFNNSMNVII